MLQTKEFAFEATLARRGYIKSLHWLQTDGWWGGCNLLCCRVGKCYICLRPMGGHDIPTVDIERRQIKRRPQRPLRGHATVSGFSLGLFEANQLIIYV